MKDKSLTVSSFRSKKEKKSYILSLTILSLLSIVIVYGLLVYNNPVPINSPSFLPVIKRRQNAIIAMAIAAICQAVGSVLFQSVTSNRIITPSILGFEAIYSTVNTAIMYFLGISGFMAIGGKKFFIFQIILMIGICLLLFMGIFNKKDGNIELMLLIGVILGQGLRSIAAFMRRLLSPSEFDILQAKLFASVNNSDSQYFALSIGIIFVVVAAIFLNTNKINVISLGKDVATNLGLNHKKATFLSLIAVAILISISTALVGPMTFYGFLVATLTYELAKTYDHKYLLIMAILLAFVILSGSYFIMNHIFNANGVVSVLIELIGGIAFLMLIFKEEKL